MRIKPMAALSAAITACTVGIAAFVMVVSAVADGPPRTKMRRVAPAAAPVETPAPSPPAPEFPELLGQPQAAPPPAEALPVAAPASLPDRLRTALRAEECLGVDEATAAIQEISVGAEIDQLAAALRELLAEDEWCPSARRALQAALDSAGLMQMAAVEPGGVAGPNAAPAAPSVITFGPATLLTPVGPGTPGGGGGSGYSG